MTDIIHSKRPISIVSIYQGYDIHFLKLQLCFLTLRSIMCILAQKCIVLAFQRKLLCGLLIMFLNFRCKFDHLCILVISNSNYCVNNCKEMVQILVKTHVYLESLATLVHKAETLYWYCKFSYTSNIFASEPSILQHYQEFVCVSFYEIPTQ